MGQGESVSDQEITKFKSTVGNQLLDLTREYIDSCKTLTDEYKSCKPFYYIASTNAKGKIRNCTTECAPVMQEKFNHMLEQGRDYGREWPFYAEIHPSSDSKGYVVPLRGSTSFFLSAPQFRSQYTIQLVHDNYYSYGNLLEWNDSMENIMFEFANIATTTKIKLSFVDATIDEKDHITVIKLLDQHKHPIDFPLQQQVVRYNPKADVYQQDEWEIILTINRPKDLEYPNLLAPSLPQNDIVPNLPPQPSLYSGHVVSRQPYRRYFPLRFYK